MVKITLKAIFILLFLFSSASAGDCPEAITAYGEDGDYITIIINTCYEPDRFWWLKDDPYTQPIWKEILRSKLKEITFQKDVSDIIIKDIEVMAAMSVLAENFSPDSRKLFYSEIDSMAKKIIPKELVVQFSHR